MKNHRFFGWLALIFLFQNLAAQPAQERPQYWQPGFSLGLASVGYGFFSPQKESSLLVPQAIFPVNGLMSNINDMEYVFRSGWGIRLIVNLMKTDSSANFNLLENKIPGYYLQKINDDFPNFLGSRVLLGGTFGRAKGRFFVQPALMLGFSAFDYRRFRISAKEKGTNSLYRLEFKPVGNARSVLSPTLLAGCKFGYFLNKRFKLYCTVDATTMRHHLKYEYLKTAAIDNAVVRELYSYKTWQSSASAQIGLSVFLGKTR